MMSYMGAAMGAATSAFGIARTTAMGIVSQTASGWSKPRGNGASAALLEASKEEVTSVFETLGTAPEGLTETEVAERLETYGPNTVAHERATPWPIMLLNNFRNPFILVLFVLGSVSYATGDLKGTAVVTVMVAVSVVMRFLQEFRSSRAAEALRAMVSTTATVTRRFAREDEEEEQVAVRREVPFEELVPGDIVHLAAGDMIPADVRLISSKDLFIGQSALTGEAMPVEKYDTLSGVVEKSAETISASPTTPSTSATPAAPAGSNPLDQSNLCFMGTTVISGSGTAVVVSTGARTVFGSLAKSVIGQRSLTSFDRGVNAVTWVLIRFIVVMVPIVFVLNGVVKGDFKEAFLFAIAVAVGLTPEMLPMVVTANLAKGAVSMARQKVIVKRLNAIQNLGAMDVLCTDKTGTLTQDRVILEKHRNIKGEVDLRVLEYAYLNSYYQTGLKNLLDRAVLEHAELRHQLDVLQHADKIDEIPFDFLRRRMSVVVTSPTRGRVLICKGAVEEVFAICAQVDLGKRAVPFSDELLAQANAVVREMNEDGFRVVAVAHKTVPVSKDLYSVADEHDLVLAGFVAFLDPPKETAREAIAALHAHGVDVIVLTGDNDIVTRRVCRDVGIPADRVTLGSDIEELCAAAVNGGGSVPLSAGMARVENPGLGTSAAVDRADSALRAAIQGVSVFAKLNPLQKARIIRALQQSGHTVGYLGDGINDSAALRDADVGISVDTATDIARESADIILLEKSLLVLETGVLKGREVYGNIIKYIKMTASSNFGNVFSVLVASAFIPFLPMLPVQLLVLNLLYDFSQLSLPWDRMDSEFLLTPRKWDTTGIARFMVWIGPISSVFDITTFLLLWFVFRATPPAGEAIFQSGWFIESLLSQTLIIHMIRTEKIPFIQSRAAAPVLLLTSLIMAAGVYLPYSPLGSAISLVHLPGAFFPWLITTLLAYGVLTQIVKTWYMRRFHAWL
jgi:Mg2+-importing ATPase